MNSEKEFKGSQQVRIRVSNSLLRRIAEKNNTTLSAFFKRGVEHLLEEME